jgi:ribosomal protein L37AE/L43A
MKPGLKPKLTCPQCSSTKIHRSKRRSILERILLYPIGYRAYRCQNCDNRFFSRIKHHVARIQS